MHPTPEDLGNAAIDSLFNEVIPKLSDDKSLSLSLERTTWDATMQVDSTWLNKHLVQEGIIDYSGSLKVMCRVKTGGGVLDATPPWHTSPCHVTHGGPSEHHGPESSTSCRSPQGEQDYRRRPIRASHS